MVPVLFFQISCNSARHVPNGEYLLKKTTIQFDTSSLDVNEMKRYELQSPNKTILGLKFHLGLYNLSNPEKEKFPNSWLRKIGEAPVIYDSDLHDRTNEQYQKYLENKGYYDAQMTDTLIVNNKKASLNHFVHLGDPLIIKSIEYIIEDTSIQNFIFRDTINSLVKVNNRFDKDVLQDERLRIEEMMKIYGFFRFSKEYVFYEAARSSYEKSIDLTIRIKQSVSGEYDPLTKVRKHKRYKIQNVHIVPNLKDHENPGLDDTLQFKESFIVYRDKLKINPATVNSANNCRPGTIYNSKEVARTYRNYTSLGLYRLVNLSFNEPNSYLSDSLGFGLLNCKIELSPRKIHSYQFEIVGTNSAGDLGVRGNLNYHNYNLFRGAEHLKIQFTGAVEALKKRQGANFAPMQEFGVETTLELPKFLLPFSANFVHRYYPKTTIQASYNYQDRPDYLRTIANASFGYRWKGNSYTTYHWIPADFNYVKLPEGIRDSSFLEDIQGTPYENSFIDHTILGTRISFEYTNQQVEKRRNFVYFKSGFESAGFLLGMFKESGMNQGSDSTLLGVEYFQYVKADFDFRQYNLISTNDRIVYRLFLGVGYPYGNSRSMPFEKMYFAGGPYGIRAWSTRTLGPGSEPDSSSTSFYANNLGDIKIEANLEYRFDLFWKMEGALFVDAGNIWLIREAEGRENATFRWSKFYKDIAIGTGVGFRFDFSFFLIRTDFGLKLRDPAITDGSKWVSTHSDYNGRWVFQFGIGYPF